MFIGIDLGTSSVKIILLDYQNILATSNASITVQNPQEVNKIQVNGLMQLF